MELLDENQPEDREKLRRYFIVFQTCMTMMYKRISETGIYPNVSHLLYDSMSINYEGFRQHPLEFTDMKFDAFLDYRTQTGLFQNRFEFSSYWLNEDGSNTMILFLPSNPDTDVNKDVYRGIIDEIIMLKANGGEPQLNSFRHFILLAEKGLGSAVKNEIKITTNIRFEVYKDSMLALDVTEHCLSPISVKQHVKKVEVPAWEKQEGLIAVKQHNIRENDLLSVMYGARVGDMLVLVTMGANHDSRIEYKYVAPPSKIEPPKL